MGAIQMLNDQNLDGLVYQYDRDGPRGKSTGRSRLFSQTPSESRTATLMYGLSGRHYEITNREGRQQQDKAEIRIYAMGNSFPIDPENEIDPENRDGEPFSHCVYAALRFFDYLKAWDQSCDEYWSTNAKLIDGNWVIRNHPVMIHSHWFPLIEDDDRNRSMVWSTTA